MLDAGLRPKELKVSVNSDGVLILIMLDAGLRLSLKMGLNLG